MTRRDRQVAFRLTHREAHSLEGDAQAAGRSVGGYIRDRLGLPRQAQPEKPKRSRAARG